MRAATEKWYPLVGSILITALYLKFWRITIFQSSIDNLFSSIITISAITIGFLATIKTIIFSINNQYIIKQLKNAGVFNEFIDYIMATVYCCFILAILSGIGLFLNFKDPKSWYQWAFGGWLFLVVYATLLSYRVLNILAKILKSPD